MAIYKCKVCAGSLNVKDDQTTVTCEYCGTQQALPKSNTDLILNLYDRANHFRRNNEFDKAEKVYQQILIEDPSDAEAYWSLVLCNYGIEYVEDPKTRKRIPTVNRAQFTSIFNDENYKKALEYGDGYQKDIFESEAKVINEIQKGILSVSQKEDPYDVFISYKETDEQGRRTRDSVLANDLYHQLTKEGFKVFFSRITLESKLGMEYEPYIFAALNSAKVMVVLGTKREYFNAVWVKNEWSRFLAVVRDSKGEKILIPAYRDMDPYDLPEEFSHLQSQDMSKLGFMQDLIRGIEKIIPNLKKNKKDNSNNKDDDLMLNEFYKSANNYLKKNKIKNAVMIRNKMLSINPNTSYLFLLDEHINFHIEKSKELFRDILNYVYRTQSLSINSIQNEFDLGFDEVALIIQDMEQASIITPNLGVKARKITYLYSIEEIDKMVDILISNKIKV